MSLCVSPCCSHVDAHKGHTPCAHLVISMCPDNQLNQWALLTIFSRLSHCLFLFHFLPDENKEQNSFFVPESETSAPDYWRESSGTNIPLTFLCLPNSCRWQNNNAMNEENTVRNVNVREVYFNSRIWLHCLALPNR